MKTYISHIYRKLKLMSVRDELIKENRSMVFDANEYTLAELKALMA